MKNWFPIIFIAIVLTSFSTATTANQPDDALFQWPSFINNHHHHDASASFIKRVQCGASIHNVYACLRSSFVKIPNHHQHQHNLLHAATDCCTTVTNFRDRCSGFRIAKLESFIFPAMLFKQCVAGGDSQAPAPAPDAADGPAADLDV
ncbi:hypothetical protein QVD17_13956 [Tagetes erecta]|uniref:Prolamin-like domain-containing protein n=1 Tax=Tagetes erecta TaxID=13708 RepID=A0AAD8KXM9_TARER|nr:hypothetical protein QVD17_13956 [Tagetes erecta]